MGLGSNAFSPSHHGDTVVIVIPHAFVSTYDLGGYESWSGEAKYSEKQFKIMDPGANQVTKVSDSLKGPFRPLPHSANAPPLQ